MESKTYDYEQCDWFHGRISKEEAFHNLSVMHRKQRSQSLETNGIFLVREKSKTYFILCLLHEKQEHKYEIVVDEATKKFKISNKIVMFDSLVKLIEFLRISDTSVSGLPCNPTVPCVKPVEADSRDIKTSLKKASRFFSKTTLSNRKKNLVKNDSKSAKLSGLGGEIILSGGCRLYVPKNCLENEVEIKLKVYTETNQNKDLDVLSPILNCNPSGIQFNRPVSIKMPVRYATSCMIQVSSDLRIWEDFHTVKLDKSGFIIFNVDHFSWYRIISTCFVLNDQEKRMFFHCYRHPNLIERVALILEISSDIKLCKLQKGDAFKEVITLNRAHGNIEMVIRHNEFEIEAKSWDVGELLSITSSKTHIFYVYGNEGDSHPDEKEFTFQVKSGQEEILRYEEFIFPISADHPGSSTVFHLARANIGNLSITQ